MGVTEMRTLNTKASHVCIFEDNLYRRLFPLVYFRPVYDLRCGIGTLREKIAQGFGRTPVSLHCRRDLAEVMEEWYPQLAVNRIESGDCLFINGRVVADSKFFRTLEDTREENIVLVHDGTVVAAFLTGRDLEALKHRLESVLSLADFGDLPTKEIDVQMINYPWDLVHRNGEAIRADFQTVARRKKHKGLEGKVILGAHLVNRKSIILERGAVVKPGVVLDAEEGPIYIGRGAEIFPNATVIGPAYIGDNTYIKTGAKIYGNTSIGEFSKVGGEVEGCIIHSYSNKQHDGFLGHSYLCSWVNLGAGTNNSDLKNNYGNVTVEIDGQKVDSGSLFVGLFMGDHSKSGINSMFNTGTVVGVCCNLFGADFPPKYVPSFSWGGAQALTTHDLDRCAKVAERVMARRQKVMTAAELKLMKRVFELTREERRSRGLVN
jgi:UDP-N-acetylglucosamine diphosphorylase/glucosamine-1-phosphate N-acetyltransferase